MSNDGLIDLLAHEVLPCEYDYLVEPTCGLMVCRHRKGEKKGYIDTTGKFVIPPKYDQTFPFNPASGLGMMMVTSGEIDSYGLIDTTGRHVVEPVYKNVDLPAEGMMRFQSHDGDQLYGFLDRTGKVAIPPTFAEAHSFVHGVAGVVYPDDLSKCYFIDHSGKHVLGPHPSRVRFPVGFDPELGLAVVEDPMTHRWRHLNRTGKPLSDRPPGINAGPCLVGLDEALDDVTKKWGLIQRETGRWIVPPKYDDILRSSFGPYYEVKIGGREKLMDLSGREFSPPEARCFYVYGCGRVPFGVGPKDGPYKWGYLAVPSGDVVIPPTFSSAGRYSEGFAVYTK
ncbi:MAG: WG repeat-containing protein [Fimbriiglobus sp.]